MTAHLCNFCEQCGQMFYSVRSDALCCSAKCRKRKSRNKVKEDYESERSLRTSESGAALENMIDAHAFRSGQ